LITMTLTAGTVLLDRFRVVARRPGGGAELFDAVELGVAARPALIGMLGASAPAREDPAAIVERASRYAAGFSAIAQPIGAGSTAEGRALVAYWSEPGTTLDALVDAKPRPSELATLVGALGRALGVLHDQGVAHGALCPELVARTQGGVRVSGFGVAALAYELGGSAFARDAVARVYRGPEWSSDAPRLDASSDVFAFGVIVAELLASRRARPGDRPTPRGLGADVSDAIEAAVAKAVHFRPGERPQSVERWSDELGRLLAEASTAAPPEPSPSLPEPALPPEAVVAPPVAEPEGAAAPPEPQVAPPPLVPPGAASPPELIGDVGSSSPVAGDRMSLMTVLVLIVGALLMLGGIVAAVAFAFSREPSSSARTTTVPAPSPFVFDGGVGSGGGSGGAPAAAPRADDAGTVANGGAAPFSMLAPSASATSSADDATAALPIDKNVPAWGPADAPVTLLVFGDFECPHTRREYAALTALKSMFGDQLRLAWRNRPEPSHAHAEVAAEVAAAVNRELGARAFWKFAAAALTSGAPATPAELDRWAVSAGATPGETGAWLRKPGAMTPVNVDLDLANRFDVRGTPTMFINGTRINGYQPYSALRALVDRELTAARAARAAGIAAGAVYATRVEHNLLELGGEPQARRCPTLTGAPARGAADALVTIVEFGDFQCPYCRRAEPALDDLMKRYPRALRVVWKSFPLPSHPRARAAARFALEARARGGATEFWRVHDLLLRANASLDDAALEHVAASAGLDARALLAAARRPVHSARIDADVEEGKRLGVDGTPTFFVNGRVLVGAQSEARFESVVREEIERAHRLLEAGTPPSDVYRSLCGGS
jgi:protein-disulfide isomerase